MNRRTKICIAAGVLLLAVCARWSILAIADESGPAAPAAQLDELANDLARLKADVQRLELRIETLRRQSPALQYRPRVIVRPQDRDRDAIPEDWTPKEFNGMRYYIVPLGRGDQQPK
jgi:hypothetical protein